MLKSGIRHKAAVKANTADVIIRFAVLSANCNKSNATKRMTVNMNIVNPTLIFERNARMSFCCYRLQI